MDFNGVVEAIIALLLKDCSASAGLRNCYNTGHDLLKSSLLSLKQWQGCPVILQVEKTVLLKV